MRGKLLIIVCGLLVFAGCDRLQNRREMSHGYKLEKFQENGKFYVYGNGSPEPGGAFEGIVLELGWGDHYMVAKVDRHVGSDMDGWYFLNLDTGSVAGPLDDEVRDKIVAEDEIEFRSAEEVWVDLK